MIEAPLDHDLRVSGHVNVDGLAAHELCRFSLERTGKRVLVFRYRSHLGG